MTNISISLPENEKKDQFIYLGKKKIPKILISVSKKVIFLGILALAVFYLLPQLSSIEKSTVVLSTLKPWAILLALATQFFSYYGSGLAISKCVNLSGHKISVFRGMLINLASTSIGLVAGGMFGSTVSIFKWVKASGGDIEGSSLAASLPPVFIDIVLIFISIIGLIFLLFIHDLTKTQVIMFLIIMFLLNAICLMFVIAANYKENSTRIIMRIVRAGFRFFKKDFPSEKYIENIQHLFSTWDYLIRGGWKGPFLGSTLNIFFDILTIYFVFIASGKTISPIILIAGYGLPWLFGRMAFIFPGGVGVIESTMVALYTSLGIENSLATVVVLTYRVISFWFPTIAGFFTIPILKKLTNHK